MERQIRQDDGGHGEGGAAFADEQHDRTERGDDQHGAGQRHAIPRPHERAHQSKGGQARRRVEVEHFDACEVFPGLRAECRQIRVQATTGDDQRNAPGERADGEGDAGAEQRARQPSTGAIGQYQHQQRRCDPERLRAEADGESGQQRAEYDHAA